MTFPDARWSRCVLRVLWNYGFNPAHKRCPWPRR